MPVVPEQRDLLVVGIGADQSGYALKEDIRALLDADPRVGEVRDFGVSTDEDPMPYPKIGLAVAERVGAGELDRAILICATGIGMAISANKVQGVRATVAYDRYSVERSVLSNDCQVLCLGGKVIMPEVARRIVTDWLGFHFDLSSPSAAKIDLLRQYEQTDMGRPARRGSTRGTCLQEQS
jgi:ribose 5-phosphate isomerase B